MSARTVIGRSPATGAGIAVEIDDGVIVAIRDADDVDDAYLSAGLIDLQVNGYAGIDLNAGTLAPPRVAALARTLLRLGVTTFLPTLVTASEDAIIRDCRDRRSACRRLRDGAYDPLRARRRPVRFAE